MCRIILARMSRRSVHGFLYVQEQGASPRTKEISLLDPRHECPTSQPCTCPRITIPKVLSEQLISGFPLFNFPMGCEQAFQDAAVGTARRRIRQLTDQQMKNLYSVLEALRAVPCSAVGLVKWAEGILSKLFISRNSSMFAASSLIQNDSSYFRLNVQLEPFFTNLRAMMADGVLPLIALVEIIPRLADKLSEAVESQDSERRRAERILTDQNIGLTRCKRVLDAYTSKHKRDEAFENMAETMDTVSSSLSSLCGTVHQSVSSNQSKATETLATISRYLQDAKNSLKSGQAVNNKAHDVCNSGEATLLLASTTLIPKISPELQDTESGNMDCIKVSLSEVSHCAREQVSHLEDLVKALETAHQALAACHGGIKSLEKSASNLKSQANTMSRTRSKSLSDAKAKVRSEAPQQLQLQAIHNTCRIHVSQTEQIVDHLTKVSESNLHAMSVAWKEINDHFLALKQVHESRLSAGDLSALTQDDLKILLHVQDLSPFADIFQNESLDGSILSSALRGKKADQTAAELEDIFKGTIKDLVGRKRVVHYIQLAYFGLNIAEHSVVKGMGTPEDPCSKWSCNRVQAELQRGGFSDVLSKLSKLNGEVLLLLTRGDLRDLGISALATQQRCVWRLHAFWLFTSNM